MQRKNPHSPLINQNAFTLIELVVAISVLFIVAMIAAPNISVINHQISTAQDVRTVALGLTELRAEAVRLKRNIRVSFTSDSMQWDIYDDGVIDGTLNLSNGATWLATPDPLLINGFGLVSGSSPTVSIGVRHGTVHESLSINTNGHISL